MSELVPIRGDYHLGYLFSAPLHPDFSLLIKIAHIAFHVLTLGIPLAVYHVVRCCLPKSAVQRALEEAQRLQTLRKQAVDSVKKASLSFCTHNNARIEELLQQNRDFIPTQFTDVSEHIGKVAALLHERYLPRLVDRLRENPWNLKNGLITIDLALDCLRLAYAAGVHMLEELPKEIREGHQQKIFCDVALIYRIVRFALVVVPKSEHRGISQWGDLRPLMKLKDNEKVVSLLAILKSAGQWSPNFYSLKEGENIRIVYNHYCQWVRAAVDSDLLGWYPLDDNPDTFEAQFKAYI